MLLLVEPLCNVQTGGGAGEGRGERESPSSSGRQE